MIAPGFGSLRQGKCPLLATMPALGLWAKRPQKAAGTRIDPPMSLPSSAPVRPAATAAAPPPVLPPAVSAGFQGFVVRPNSLLTDCQSAFATGTLVLPRITAPAARSRCTLGASSSAMASAGLDHAARRWQARDMDAVLDSDRQSGEHSRCRPLLRVDPARSFERALIVRGHDRVDPGVQPFASLRVQLDDGDAGNLAPVNRGNRRARVCERIHSMPLDSSESVAPRLPGIPTPGKALG